MENKEAQLSEAKFVHLIIDGYGGDPAKLKDNELIYRFLDEHPDTIGMTKMAPPQVHAYHGQTAEDWGVSGFVLIAESHISVHTFPDRRYVNVDIFSCKEFDAAASLREVQSVFSLCDVNAVTLDRGVEHSTSEAAHDGMVRQRVSLASGARPG